MQLTESTVVEKADVGNLFEKVDQDFVAPMLDFIQDGPIVLFTDYGENAVFVGSDGRSSQHHFIWVVFVDS